MYDTILVPTDGSEVTERTLESALPIARSHDATLHVLYVMDRRMYLAASKETQDDVLDDLRAEGEAAIADVEALLADEDLEVVTEIREGIPHRDILEYAEEHDVSMIAIGTHGRSGRDRLMNLGSVTEKVVDDATRPVLVVSPEA